jgi:hypothetical protein
MALFTILPIIYLAVCILLIAAMWTAFNKAGQPGWAVIIPIYNAIVFFRVIGKPWWWLFLCMIPIINIIWVIWSLNLLSKSFGRNEGFTVGLILLPVIFIPILGFGSKYVGPAGKKS